MDKCFAETNKPDTCKVLKTKECDGCSFYKTKEQFRQDYANSIDALKNRLDETTCREIEEKYGLSRFLTAIKGKGLTVAV